MMNNLVEAKYRINLHYKTPFFVIVMLLCSNNIYSQTLDFISISVGNYMEGAFSDIPDGKLSNIFTTPMMAISSGYGTYYDYEFRLYGDTISCAKWWLTTYYDTTLDKTASFTIYAPSNIDYFRAMQINNPVTDGFIKDCYFYKNHILNVTSATFKLFVSNIIEKQVFIDAYSSEQYVIGAGVPESIILDGTLLNFEPNKPMYYFMAIDPATNTATDICYQYFDSSEISCIYTSIKETNISNLFVAPNPTNNGTTLSFTVLTSGDLNIKIVNVEGQELLELHNAHTDAGEFTKTFSMSKFPAGVYFIKINHNGNIKTEQIIRK